MFLFVIVLGMSFIYLYTLALWNKNIKIFFNKLGKETRILNQPFTFCDSF